MKWSLLVDHRHRINLVYTETMKTLFLTLLLFSVPAHAWEICFTGEPDSCSTEEYYSFDDQTYEGIAKQEAFDEAVTILIDQLWNDIDCPHSLTD